MSTKIDRANAATPSVPTQPTEPVKAAEAPRAPGKADVEPAVVQDVIERGASMLDAGRMVFGIASKTAAQAIEGAAKDGAARVTKTVAELQADATHAVKQAVTQNAKPLASDGAVKLVSDLLTKGVEQTVKDEFKAIRPAIADAARVADQIGRASDLVEQRLRGVPDEVRGRAAELLLDIKNNTAPYVTAEDLKLPFTEPRRIVAEMVQVGEELGTSALSAVAKGAMEVGLAGADVIATHGDGVRDAAEVAERYLSGRFLTDGTMFEGIRPFALINLPLVKLLDGVQSVVGGAEKVTAQADNLRAFVDTLTPGTTQADILALKPDQSLQIALGGKAGLGLGPALGVEHKLDLKVTRQPGEPATYIAEITQEKGLNAGFDLKAADLSLNRGEVQKITVELKGEQAVKDFVSTLYGHGLGVIDDDSALQKIAEKTTFEVTGQRGLSLGVELGSAKAEMKRSFAVTTGESVDKQGETTMRHVKLSTSFESGGSVNATGGIKVRLPQAPGEQGAALRAAMVNEMKQMAGFGSLIRHMPAAALDRMCEINGLRTDVSLKGQHQVELQLDLPANIEDLGKATQLTLTNTVAWELGDSQVEAKLEIAVKNPAALFKLFGELPPHSLVAALGDGRITHEDIEARAAQQPGLKLSDILSVKVTAGEKTTRATGAEVEADENALKAERGVTQHTPLGKLVLVGEESHEANLPSPHQAPVLRTIMELGHNILRG